MTTDPTTDPTAHPVALPEREGELVRARLAGVGLGSMIDVHTHFMPERVLKKVWAFFDGVGARTGRAWPIAYRVDDAERVRLLGEFGVEAFTSLAYPHKPDMAAWLNAWTTDFAERTPGCLRSGTFYPEPGAEAYVAEAIAAGTRVFKAHVQVGDYDPNDPLLDEVWGVLEEAGTPVVIHCGDGPNDGRFTGPDGAARLLERFPRLTLVVAHMGLPDYGAFLDLAAAHPRVHLDTTMVFTDFTEANHPFPRDLRPRLLDLGDRIVFGSDFPNIPYPYVEAVDAVLVLDLGDAWARAVLRDNAARLFGLS